MKHFSYSTTPTGLIKYCAMDGFKDDIVMAANYALEGLRQHRDRMDWDAVKSRMGSGLRPRQY